MATRTQTLPGCYAAGAGFAVVGLGFDAALVTPSGTPLPALSLLSAPEGLAPDATGHAVWTPAPGQETAVYPDPTPVATVAVRATNVEGTAISSVTLPSGRSASTTSSRA